MELEGIRAMIFYIAEYLYEGNEQDMQLGQYRATNHESEVGTYDRAST